MVVVATFVLFIVVVVAVATAPAAALSTVVSCHSRIKRTYE